MERHAAAVAIDEGKMNEFKKKLGEIWPDLTAWLDKNKVTHLHGYQHRGKTCD